MNVQKKIKVLCEHSPAADITPLTEGQGRSEGCTYPHVLCTQEISGDERPTEALIYLSYKFHLPLSKMTGMIFFSRSEFFWITLPTDSNTKVHAL